MRGAINANAAVLIGMLGYGLVVLRETLLGRAVSIGSELTSTFRVREKIKKHSESADLRQAAGLSKFRNFDSAKSKRGFPCLLHIFTGG